MNTAAYRDLEVLEIDIIDIHSATCIIKNSGRCLRNFLINWFFVDYDDFNDESLNFIRTIGENSYLIERLSIPLFPLSENHNIEFEKLIFVRCGINKYKGN